MISLTAWLAHLSLKAGHLRSMWAWSCFLHLNYLSCSPQSWWRKMQPKNKTKQRKKKKEKRKKKETFFFPPQRWQAEVDNLILQACLTYWKAQVMSKEPSDNSLHAKPNSFIATRNFHIKFPCVFSPHSLTSRPNLPLCVCVCVCVFPKKDKASLLQKPDRNCYRGPAGI